MEYENLGVSGIGKKIGDSYLFYPHFWKRHR